MLLGPVKMKEKEEEKNPMTRPPPEHDEQTENVGLAGPRFVLHTRIAHVCFQLHEWLIKYMEP